MRPRLKGGSSKKFDSSDVRRAFNTFNTVDLPRSTRLAQSKGYFGDLLSHSLSLPFSLVFSLSLFRSVHLAQIPLLSFFRVAHFSSCNARSPHAFDAGTSIFVELHRIYAAPSLRNRRHVRAMHAPELRIWICSGSKAAV